MDAYDAYLDELAGQEGIPALEELDDPFAYTLPAAYVICDPRDAQIAASAAVTLPERLAGFPQDALHALRPYAQRDDCPPAPLVFWAPIAVWIPILAAYPWLWAHSIHGQPVPEQLQRLQAVAPSSWLASTAMRTRHARSQPHGGWELTFHRLLIETDEDHPLPDELRPDYRHLAEWYRLPRPAVVGYKWPTSTPHRPVDPGPISGNTPPITSPLHT